MGKTDFNGMFADIRKTEDKEKEAGAAAAVKKTIGVVTGNPFEEEDKKSHGKQNTKGIQKIISSKKDQQIRPGRKDNKYKVIPGTLRGFWISDEAYHVLKIDADSKKISAAEQYENILREFYGLRSDF